MNEFLDALSQIPRSFGKGGHEICNETDLFVRGSYKQVFSYTILKYKETYVVYRVKSRSSSKEYWHSGGGILRGEVLTGDSREDFRGARFGDAETEKVFGARRLRFEEREGVSGGVADPMVLDGVFTRLDSREGLEETPVPRARFISCSTDEEEI